MAQCRAASRPSCSSARTRPALGGWGCEVESGPETADPVTGPVGNGLRGATAPRTVSRIAPVLHAWPRGSGGVERLLGTWAGEPERREMSPCYTLCAMGRLSTSYDQSAMAVTGSGLPAVVAVAVRDDDTIEPGPSACLGLTVRAGTAGYARPR